MAEAYLEKTEEALEVRIGRTSNFSDILLKIKSIPGHRFDGQRKVWMLPCDPMTAERIIHSIQPEADPSIAEWARNARQEQAKELTTPLPEDAKLKVPWASDLFKYQRAAISLMAAERFIILADDMGLGKTTESISAVTECLLRCCYEAQSLLCLGEKEPRTPSGTLQGLLEGLPGPSWSDNPERQEEALQGLLGRASSGDHGLGPRKGREDLCPRSVDEAHGSEGDDAHGGCSGGDREVRRALPELSSTAALSIGPKLVICPNSVKGVWAREVKQWTGEDSVVIVSASTAAAREKQIRTAIANNAWVVVNYEQIRAQQVEIDLKNGGTKKVWKMKQPLFESTPWVAVIADEAHRAKNRRAQVSRGLHRIDAPIKFAASGTPLMNTPDELWSILKWLFPKEYTSYWRFYEQYVDYTEGYFGKIITGVKNADALRFELRNRLIRRTKDEVLDLPGKIRSHIPVDMTPPQRKAYESAEKEIWLTIEKEAAEGDKSAEKILAADSMREVFKIPNGATRFLRLRMIAETLATLGGPDESGKLDAIVETIVDAQPKQFTVFTLFKETTACLARRLTDKGLDARVYTGDTPNAERTELEREFQAGEIDVLIGTIAAMGEGVTLTACDTPIFVSRDVTPARNEQAEDRQDRIGQTNKVTVLIFEANDTIDTGKVKPMIRRKEAIVSTVIMKDSIKEAV